MGETIVIKKVLLIALVGVVIGIVIWPFIGAIPIVSTLQPIFTQALAAWESLPNMVKGLITLGIPSILAIFFAWTKTRAMDKLQQTKLEATSHVNQIQGEANEQISVLQQENETLRNQAGEGVTELATKLSTAETTITSQQTEINRLTTRVNEAEHLANVVMHPTESDLKKRLEQAGYTITKTAA